MSDTLIQKGHVLVAEPALTGDVSFSRAVILIAAAQPERLCWVHTQQTIVLYLRRTYRRHTLPLSRV